MASVLERPNLRGRNRTAGAMARQGPALAVEEEEEEAPVAAAPVAAAPAIAPAPALTEPAGAPAGAPPQVTPESKDIFEQSVEASKTAPEEEVARMANVLDDVMGPGSYVDAFKELYDKIQPQKDIEEYKLTDRQKGLAIMDFGLRMMAGGPNETFAGAVGRAGLETRKATEALKDREYQKELAQNKRDIAVTGSALDKYFKDRRQSELEWTTDGLMTVNPVTGQAAPILGAEGKPVQAGSTPGGFGSRPTEKQWLYTTALDLGYSPDQALAISKGGMNRTQAEQEAAKFVNLQISRTDSVMIPDRGMVKKRDMTDQDYNDFVRYYADIMMSIAPGQEGPALGPAGARAGAATAPPPRAKPTIEGRKALSEIEAEAGIR